ncbi:hypothetical protein PISMIDRAFT_9618 [Pisolithus microcarpus 441]|uniref:Uncharacterized protein n=1 Tax=Pisolithus microcarpus 441 TaxID=765257 RepID=A0A0C9Z7T5_9AGAM|nr:hypothetical protein PISMIDRAFT_9618 [Pisolithus microcarpus 441]
MPSDSTQELWCICRKYCKGVRTRINTLSTWRRHLREAAADEIESIQLAKRSDDFRAFINAVAGPSCSSDKRPGDEVSNPTGITKRVRTSQESSPTPQEGSTEDVRAVHNVPAFFEGDDHQDQGLYHGQSSSEVSNPPGAAEWVHASHEDVLGSTEDIVLSDSRDGHEGQTDNHELTNHQDEHHHAPPFLPIPPPPMPPDPLLHLDLDELAHTAILPKLKRSMSFIQAIRGASLGDGVGLTGEALERLRNPPQEPLSVDDWYRELSLSIFIALEHSSESTYEKIRKAIEKCFPEAEIASFHQTKRVLADLSGVTSVAHHMCVNSCAAYVGPFSDLDTCPECDEPRYDQVKLNRSSGRVKHPRAVFHTIPIAPQLQSLWRHPESAEKMRYRHRRTQQIFDELRRNDGLVDTYDDVFCGQAYLDAVTQNKIHNDDILLMLSIDGAQLYESKESDCWIYIWIVLELSPDHRYKKKHVLPGAIIPGPRKPKIIDSFLFPGLHHLSAVQHEGLRIWDASQDRAFTS